MAKLLFKHSESAYGKFRVFIQDTTSAVGAGLTGLTFASSGLAINTIADNEASATSYTAAGSTIETITTIGTFAAPTATKCRFKEIDSTNLPGWYEIQVADARWAVSGARALQAIISVTGGFCAPVEVQLVLVDVNNATTMGLTNLDAAVSTRSTYAGGDTSGVTTLLTRIGSSITISGGRVNADTVYWGGAAVSSSNSPGIPSVEWTPWGYKTAQTSGASTITLANADRSEDNFYQGTIIAIIAGTGKYQARNILSYVGATRVATVDQPWIIAPDNTSIYAIYPSVGNMIAALNDLSGPEIADAVWDDLVMDHVNAGTMGLQLGTIPTTGAPSVGSIADAVWDELIAGHAIVGSTGEALSDAAAGGGGGGGGATAQEIWEYATRTLTSVGTVIYLGPVSPTDGVVTIYRGYAYKTVYGNALAWSSDDWPTITGCTPKLLIGGVTISGTLTVNGTTRTVTFEIDDTISATIALTAKSYKVYADFASPDDNVILTTGPAVIIANG